MEHTIAEQIFLRSTMNRLHIEHQVRTFYLEKVTKEDHAGTVEMPNCRRMNWHFSDGSVLSVEYVEKDGKKDLFVKRKSAFQYRYDMDVSPSLINGRCMNSYL